MELIGGSCIINPLGQVIAKAATTGDELIVSRIDLDQMAPVRKRWNFLGRRQPQHYGPLLAARHREGDRTDERARRASTLIVRGGQVVTASDVFEAAVAIKGDKIAAIGPEALLPPADRVIDARASTSCPGSSTATSTSAPEYDDWKTAPLAAARTGLTTLLPFVVYDEGETLPKAVARLREEAQALSVLDFGFHFILNHEPAHPRRHRRAVPDGRHVVQALHDVQEAAQAHGLRRVHRQDHGAPRPPSAASASSTARTATSSATSRTRPSPRAARRPTDFPATCPDWTEEEAINRAILIGRLTDCPVYVVHLSHQARARAHQARAGGRAAGVGGDLPAVPPPHRQGDGAPGPLRQDRPAAPARRRPRPRRALGGHRSGASSPRSRAITRRACRPPRSRDGEHLRRSRTASRFPSARRRSRRWCRSMYSEGVVNRGLPMTWMARVLAENPARIFGLYPRKGVIRVGADADLTIWDPAPAWTIERTQHLGIAGFTPYEGWQARGRPWMTLLRGQVVLDQRRRARAEAGLRPVTCRAARARWRPSAGSGPLMDYLDRLAALRRRRPARARCPPQRVAAAKLVLLDTLGAIVAGSALPENRRLAELAAAARAARAGRRCSATAMQGRRASGRRSPTPPRASRSRWTRAIGWAAAIPAIHVMPGALAVAEERGVGGRAAPRGA